MPQVSRFVTAARRKDQKSALHPSFKANFPPSPRKDDYDSEAPDFLCTINKVVQWVKELPEYFFLSSRHMSSFNQDRPAATLKRPANVRFSEQVERGNR